MSAASLMPAAGRSSRRPHGRSRVTATAVAAAVVLVPLCFSLTFAMQPGMTRKQLRGTMHNKDRLPTLYELPLETPEPEPEPREPEPDRRVPYTMSLVLQFANDGSPSRNFVQQKITQALENTENLVRHVDVRVQRLEHFHREKEGRSPRLAPEDLENGPALMSSKGFTGAEALAPYQLTVKVELTNHRRVILSNPEKHARPTLTEAVDHAADVLRKLMREEKEKDIRVWRKRHQVEKEDRLNEDFLADDEALVDWQDTYNSAADEEMEALYRAVEADDGEEEPAAAEEQPETPSLEKAAFAGKQ
mmetsp:Transcript_93907/g.303343  ORF Transcript_93907/g.303343 Transcript_93907/m.303343 type:complete len:305 (+) Transcript_93907:82-996(+)